MYKLSIRVTMFLMLFATTGCDSSTDNAEDHTHDEIANTVIDMPELAKYYGPAIDFRVKPEESATQFNWSVRVLSGGWEIKFDGALTNPCTGHATIKLLLIKPGPDEMVNQALATLTGQYRHGAQSFKTVDLIVKQITRGEAEENAEYKRAEIWKAED